MPGWQGFFANYGQLLAGLFAVLAALVGIISAYVSKQLTDESNIKLERAGQIIERLEKQVSTVIGDEWQPLTTEEVDLLRQAAEDFPNKKPIQIMYLNAFGKSFAQSIATAFRAARWDVRFSTGGGFEAGIEVGRGQSAIALIEAMARVIDPSLLVGKHLNEPVTPLYFIGVGSKPMQ